MYVACTWHWHSAGVVVIKDQNSNLSIVIWNFCFIRSQSKKSKVGFIQLIHNQSTKIHKFIEMSVTSTYIHQVQTTIVERNVNDIDGLVLVSLYLNKGSRVCRVKKC
jgi:hypothetical protein